jgi:hypothetical protein
MILAIYSWLEEREKVAKHSVSIGFTIREYWGLVLGLVACYQYILSFRYY